MKIERKEIIKHETYNIYIASDGTEFKNEEECKRYEDTAKCVLLSKYKNWVVKYTNEYALFNAGCEENYIDIILITKDKIDTILQLNKLIGYANEETLQRDRDILESSIGELFLIGRGDSYDENFWIMKSLRFYVNKITNLYHEYNNTPCTNN